MHTDQLDTAGDWSVRLRGVGLKATAGRVAALHYVEAHPHVSVTQIHTALASELPSLSAQSVHNIAHDLTSHGMLRRIDLPNSTSALYETRTGDNHHHVQCVSCHRIIDIDCVVGEAPCLVPHEGHGMRILEAQVVLRGICEACEADEKLSSLSIPLRKDQHD